VADLLPVARPVIPPVDLRLAALRR
jgi:hypothetical protein